MCGLNQIRIRGGTPLQGEVTIQGSKNAALPMMAAALLHKGNSVLLGCPRITDVYCMEKILKSLGARTWWEENNLHLDCQKADGFQVPEAYTKEMRSSVILLGALLGRGGKGIIGYPGGCIIGKRPIDLHLKTLQTLGVEILEKDQAITASCSKIKGNHVYFPSVSVGATEQGMLAAVLGEGTTCLHNCAKEPEIWWLQEFLKQMGASVAGAGTETICIRGVDHLKDTCFTVPPDRIVAGTYLCAAAITRSRITLKNCPAREMKAFLCAYRKMGGQYAQNNGTLVADARMVRSPIWGLATAVYPGFPTDLQSPLMAVLTTVSGQSHLIENIFEDRYKTVQELLRMGADIQVRGRDAWINGPKQLHGSHVTAKELRGGAALVLAGLAACGETIIDGRHYIDRGYENICRDIAGLGGNISN